MTKPSRESLENIKPQTSAGLRAFERYPVDWQATVKCPDWTAAERFAAANVSRGGMFLRTNRSFEIGARVEVTLKLPDASDVTVLATVRHVRGADGGGGVTGIGVEADATHRNELFALVEIARIRQGKPPEAPELTATLTAAAQPAVRRRVAFPRGNVCPIVGIDLGTSSSGLAVGVNDAVYSVPDALGRVRVPSLVSYAAAGGKPVAGWDALQLQRSNPSLTVGGVKPLLGRPIADPVVAHYLARSPVATVAGPNQTLQFDLPHQKLDVAQICARVLRHLKETVQPQLGAPVEQAVVAHPATFGPEQIEALQRAAQMAGITVLSMIPEALASARAMGLGAGDAEIIAVCDFGGGSFDCTVIELGAREYRVLASASDPEIGGNEFDDQLATSVVSAVQKRCGVQLQPASAEWQSLRLRSERAKRRLATDEATSIDLPPCDKEDASGAPRQQIDRAAYERICQSLLQRATQLCIGVLKDAGLSADQLAQVVLTGGMFHLPFVRRTFEVLLGRQLGDISRHDDFVALGAGLVAAQMTGHLAHQVRRLAQ